MVQKDPAGDMIEHVEGSDLQRIIDESNALAVYFCKLIERNLYYDKIEHKQGVGK